MKIKFLAAIFSILSSTAFSNTVPKIKYEEVVKAPGSGRDVVKTEYISPLVEREFDEYLNEDDKVIGVGTCVAQHHSWGGSRMWTQSGLVTAVAVDVYLACAGEAVTRGFSPCGCWVACSPTPLPSNWRELVSGALVNVFSSRIRDAVAQCL